MRRVPNVANALPSCANVVKPGRAGTNEAGQAMSDRVFWSGQGHTIYLTSDGFTRRSRCDCGWEGWPHVPDHAGVSAHARAGSYARAEAMAHWEYVRFPAALGVSKDEA